MRLDVIIVGFLILARREVAQSAVDLARHMLNRPAKVEFPHGFKNWPYSPAQSPSLPECLPDGRAWPSILVLTVADPGQAGLEATSVSIAHQGYPRVRHVVVRPRKDNRPGAVLARAIEHCKDDFVLMIAPGDLLAPGALAGAALAAITEDADAVVGLRVVFDQTGVRFVDILSSPPGPLDPRCALAAIEADEGGTPFKGSEILFSMHAITRAGGICVRSEHPVATLWSSLADIRARIALIGRPILLQAAVQSGRRSTSRALRLNILALNDRGFSGGAGIAHRRLVEALRYAGHRVEVRTLDSESGLAAAEWTEHFPNLETEVAESDFDFVLAGNIHGATRSASVLARIHQHAPVFAVTHDLFMLTGRCAHPDSCTRVEFGCDRFCPTPTYYPQLAPARIQEAWRSKQRFLALAAPPTLLANSSWAADRIRALAPPRSMVERIDLPFPTQVFRPRDRAALRRELDLPQDRVLVMFAAVIADAPSKGFDDLVAALRKIARPGVGFVAIGRIDDPRLLCLPGLVATGPITDEEILARWYAACDLCITASRLETLGQTPIEAGLCGTPTVAYGATGLTTAVIDGLSGRLADINLDALVATIEELIEDKATRQSFGMIGRIALESRNSHAASYLGLHHVLARQGLVPDPAEVGRIRLAADVLKSFDDSIGAHPGAIGTVQPSSHKVVRLLRRAKQMVWGRRMPLWMRRFAYAGYRLRQIMAQLENAGRVKES